ncbi:MAG: DNA replication/repair protein RecF [Bacilli bacterium]|nr:DNA replication/repair protein RecF [Bacilli bacterium]
MYLKNLEIVNFRNIDRMNLDFNKNVNIFIGKNAQGKTSILESIYNLAFTKSSKNFSDDEFLKRGKNFFKIKGTLKIGNALKKMEVLYGNDEKKVKINDVLIARISDYVSNMNVIMFTPDDLDIVKKAPLVRRSFINIELCQLYNKYLVVLNEYNKILKMRNEYIRKHYSNIDYNYLDVLTVNLIDRAMIIYDYRDKYFDDINNYLEGIYYKIMKIHGLKVVYKKSIDLKTKEEYISFYKENYFSDIEKGATNFGPHKDDFSFYIDEEDIKFYGSQGMQRIAILSFKLAEINLFKDVKNNYPIVLLDDIFSEIDLERRKNLLRFIKSNIQFIITTTDINNISDRIIERASVFTVKEGQIVKRSDK